MNAEQVRRFQNRRRTAVSIPELVDGVKRGDRAALARAITLVESTRPDDQEKAHLVLEELLKDPTESIRVGITGVPGSGKSTFIEALGGYLINTLEQKVAVLAIDPSSPVSGGSILGDKTRMARLSGDPRAFIRPSPSAGSLGGVAWRTRETILLCEAAGYSNILVETVGVGQSETAVASMTDFFLLLMIPGAGDELQGMKRGIIEMTDLIAINKAEGENRARAEAARQQYASALHLFPAPAKGWKPKVVTCSALQREGIADIWRTVHLYREQMSASGYFRKRRAEQAKKAMHESIQQELLSQFLHDAEVQARISKVEADVSAGRLSAYRAAQQLLKVHNGNSHDHSTPEPHPADR
jgi:LAO/AO transport system kinase